MKIFVPPSLIKAFGMMYTTSTSIHIYMFVGGELYLVAIPHTMPHMVS